MKAQHAVGLRLSWPRAVVVFLLDVGLLVAARHWPGDPRHASPAWWTGVGVAAVLTAVALISYHRVPLGSALVARLVDRYAEPEPIIDAENFTVTDHRRRYGREPVGVREHRGRLVTVIAVAEREAPAAGRHRRGTDEPVALPVGTVAAALRQFDVELDRIDIVSVRAGGAEGRETWLILRMDPHRNVPAVAARDSVAAVMAAATERLAQDLDGRDITARALTADEFAAVDTAVLAGLQSRRQKEPPQFVTNAWVTPADIDSQNLEQLWSPDVDAAVLTVSLTPVSNRTQIAVLVRYHSAERLTKEQRAGLNRFIGRRLSAIYPSLPIPEPGPRLVVPARELRDDEQLALALHPVERQPAAASS